MITKNDILTRSELADKLSCHVNSISNWEKKGLIAGHRMGRKVYFNGNEVLTALGMISSSGVPATNSTDKQ
jgi:hypothetical protein